MKNKLLSDTKIFSYRERILRTVRGEIVKVVTVRSAHGATYRIKIPLFFDLAGVFIKTQVTVADRQNLKYPMIRHVSENSLHFDACYVFRVSSLLFLRRLRTQGQG